MEQVATPPPEEMQPEAPAPEQELPPLPIQATSANVQREAQRIDPARVSRPHDHLGRSICAGSCDPTVYYNNIRTHRSLNKDMPISRAVQPTGRTSHMPSSVAFITITADLGFSVYTMRCEAGRRYILRQRLEFIIWLLLRLTVPLGALDRHGALVAAKFQTGRH